MTSSSVVAAEPHANGQSVDWAAALAAHDRWLRTVAFSRLRNRDEVDEVMQELALAVVRQAASVRPSAPLREPAKLAPWLYRMMVRQVLMYRRKHGRRRKLWSHYAASGNWSADDCREPLSWLLTRERGELVRQALAALPERDAEILLLKYTEDWNYHQIAEHLGVSHSAVETRLFRARRRLRESLSGLTAGELVR